MEERVIAGVNYLASDANVSLVDFSMGGQKTVTGTTDATAVNGQPVETAAIPVRTITARFSLVGDYDKIRIFLDGLAHMPIFNTIKSLEIMKQLVTKTDGTTITGTNLLATINVDFGYQDILKIKPGSLATFSPELDNDTISVLQKYVSIKSSQSIDNGSGSISGKTNPFMAN
jgi:hypothetical protein